MGTARCSNPTITVSIEFNVNHDAQRLSLPVSETASEAKVPVNAWRWALTVLAAVIVGQLLLYRETAISLATIWNRSETYTHGWIIAPISGYLIWLRRQELSNLVPRPSVLGALVWAGLNVLWLIGHLAGALVVTQYALVAMVPVLVWAILGTVVAWSIAFPLFFLLLAVPSGEALVPGMIDFTADFTVKMLQLTGIPVYREGTYFSVPSGDWSVVEACSGIRYLIASFTGGCLFAYLYYRSAWKRLAVIVASLLIPILANGLRAYMIVMIGHLSEMRLAVGVDHFIYGWVFFGVVMFGLFWVASLWRENDVIESAPALAPQTGTQRFRLSALLVMVAALGIVGVAWRAYAGHLDARAMASTEPQLSPVAAQQPWISTSEEVTPWEPRYRGFDKAHTQIFSNEGKRVALKVLYYRGQTEGHELISSTNLVVSGNDPIWRIVGQRKRDEPSGGFILRETELRHDNQRLLVWDWYVVDGQSFANPFLGKWLLAKDRILGRTGEGAAVFLAVVYENQPESARVLLRQYLSDMNAGINQALDRVKEH